MHGRVNTYNYKEASCNPGPSHFYSLHVDIGATRTNEESHHFNSQSKTIMLEQLHNLIQGETKAESFRQQMPVEAI